MGGAQPESVGQEHSSRMDTMGIDGQEPSSHVNFLDGDDPGSIHHVPSFLIKTYEIVNVSLSTFSWE
jgi:hypothetical protein